MNLVYKNLKQIYPNAVSIGDCYMETNGSTFLLSEYVLEGGIIDENFGISLLAKYGASKTPDDIIEAWNTIVVYKSATNEIIELPEKYHTQIKFLSIEKDKINLQILEVGDVWVDEVFAVDFEAIHTPIAYNFVPYTSFENVHFGMPISEARKCFSVYVEPFKKPEDCTVLAYDKLGFYLHFDKELLLEYVEIFGPIKLNLNGVEIFDVFKNDLVNSVINQNIEHKLGGQDIDIKQ